MSHWLDSITFWLEAHPQWLGLAIFLLACFECLAIAGLLVPGTVVLFAAGVLAGSGALSLWETLLLGYFGGLLGDALSYALGRRFHQNIRRLPLLRDRPQWLQGAESYFQRYGVVSLLVGRYIGPLRPMLPMVAGMLDMPLPRFIAVSMLAASGWSVAYLMPGWATGAALRLPLPDGFWSAAGITAATVAIMLGVIIHSSLREQRIASPLAAILNLLALAALLIGWPHLHTLDQGLMTLIQEQRHPLLDSAMVLVTRMGDHSTQVAAGVLLVLLLLFARRWRAAIFAGSTLLATSLGVTLLKLVFARSRPDVLAEPLQTFSFPSGHSSSAFALFLVLGVLAGRGQSARMRLTWMLLACLPALAIALSRVYLGVHWPTDVLAGSLLASGLCCTSLALVQYRQPLPALSAKVWWLVLPVLTALLVASAIWALPEAMEKYRY
jgi:undecaprenyl-diphosphatase